jgi:hypothetical protein
MLCTLCTCYVAFVRVSLPLPLSSPSQSTIAASVWGTWLTGETSTQRAATRTTQTRSVSLSLSLLPCLCLSLCLSFHIILMYIEGNPAPLFSSYSSFPFSFYSICDLMLPNYCSFDSMYIYQTHVSSHCRKLRSSSAPHKPVAPTLTRRREHRVRVPPLSFCLGGTSHRRIR